MPKCDFILLHLLHTVITGKTLQYPEAAIRSVLCEKVFLEISQNSQKNACVRVSF